MPPETIAAQSRQSLKPEKSHIWESLVSSPELQHYYDVSLESEQEEHFPAPMDALTA
jgi:hypothetical protein